METTVQNKEKKGLAWKSVLIGGIPGVMLGAVGGAAAANLGNESQPADEAPQDSAVEENGPELIHSEEGQTFAEAFAEAREELGPGGVFEWNGNYYNTFYQNEWDAMSDDEKEEFLQSFYTSLNDDPSQGESPVTVTPGDGPSGINVNVAVNVSASVTTTDPGGELVIEEPWDEPEIHIISVHEDVTEDGILVTSVDAVVDGQDAMIVDVDGDGVMDEMSIDYNGDGDFSADETANIEEIGLTVDELNDMVDASCGSDPSELIYADTPDYTNDADISSFA